MKKQKIIIILLILAIYCISSALLTCFFEESLCDILKVTLEAVMTSCLIALPGYCFLIIPSYKRTNQNISSLYFEIYFTLQEGITESSIPDHNALKKIINILKQSSIKIGQFRESSIVDKKYNQDELTESITELISKCQKYLDSTSNTPEEIKSIKWQQIKDCKEKILNQICRVEKIIENKSYKIDD